MIEKENLVPHIAFHQSLACARSPYQEEELAGHTIYWHCIAVPCEAVVL
jgi:hypothetical protein